MSYQERLLRWDEARSSFQPAEDPGEITIVDSWLVADGRVRTFNAHVRRFSAACLERGALSESRIREFMLAAMAQIPVSGYWFPRAEMTLVAGVPQFQMRIRPAPQLGHTVRLWLSPEPDVRKLPQIKGPDLEWLAKQRMAAVAAGADEAVLLSPDGHLREGSTTNILWWRGDTLCTPADDGSMLPGITRSILLETARESGVTVVFESPFPAELSGIEVWAVNALHGIRPVIEWVDAGIGPGTAFRAESWQRRLEDTADPAGLGE
jgi:branched-subunit amino acid aminotransferase/4-amino-4-deoxychorismate lyase